MSIFSPDNATLNDAPGNDSPEAMARGRLSHLEAGVYNLVMAADRDMRDSSSFSRAAEAIVGVASNSPETGMRAEDAPRPELTVIAGGEEDIQQPTPSDTGNIEARISQAQAIVEELYGLQEAV